MKYITTVIDVHLYVGKPSWYITRSTQPGHSSVDMHVEYICESYEVNRQTTHYTIAEFVVLKPIKVMSNWGL